MNRKYCPKCKSPVEKFYSNAYYFRTRMVYECTNKQCNALFTIVARKVIVYRKGEKYEH